MRLKSTIFVLLFAFICGAQVMATSTEGKSNKPTVQKKEKLSLSAYLYDVRDKLEEKEATEGLSKKEALGLKVIDKKLNKLEKKNAKRVKKGKPMKDKSWTTALILVILLGGLGIHRFYLGYTWQGIVQLLTFGGLGIWTLIDFIRIITRSLEPKDGKYRD